MRGRWVTPENAPVSFECRSIFVPTGQSWQAILTGCLLALTRHWNFEQVTGVSPEYAAEIFEVMFNEWDRENCPMFPGMVIPAACETVNSERWLLCDGTAYQQSDYPDLYAAIGTAFGSDGAGTFRVPNLAGRMPLGAGTGDGLTPRELGDSGGSEVVELTVGELPAHDHSISASIPFGATPGPEPIDIYDPIGFGSTGETGENDGHENMPPFLALNFFIYTG